MKVCIVGTGYVGLPTGVGFAELGHNVVCVDKIETKINDLNNGIITLFERGLEELFLKNLHKNIFFTTNMADGIKDADVVIIAVGTPSHPETQEADLRYIYCAAEEIATHIEKYTVVATKSTVPVGTNDEIEKIIKQLKPDVDVDVVSVPEFLREGFAVEDFFNPDRIVIGTKSDRAQDVMKELYRHFEDKTSFLFVSRRSAETIKYASNSFLAVKIHYVNEMANFCEKAGADINEVTKGMGLDSRIGPKFLQPGPGYGGSCFPKDTAAMKHMAKKFGVDLHLVNTAIKQNECRKLELAQRIKAHLNGNPKPVVAALGLTFKGGTDDVRESPAIAIIQELLKAGVDVRVYDPKGMRNAQGVLGDGVKYCESVSDACRNADLCVILTEWDEFKNIDFRTLRLRKQSIIDYRNILDKELLSNLGYKYINIGEN